MKEERKNWEIKLKRLYMA